LVHTAVWQVNFRFAPLHYLNYNTFIHSPDQTCEVSRDETCEVCQTSQVYTGDTMTIQLVLDPDLPLTAADFAAAWNDTPACVAAATADVAPADPAAFFLPPELLAAGLVVLSDVSIGVAGNALYDLIKTALARRSVKKTTEIIQIEQPDGTKVLVVRIVEG
jgi:hypothetical protein